MNCNDTLDAFLDDKFSSSLELEDHLSRCPRCRSLFVAISPMLEAQDVSGSAEGLSFSEHQSSSPTALDIATSSVIRLKIKPLSQSQSQYTSLKKLKYVAAFLAGVAASFGCLAVIRSESFQPPSPLTTTCLRAGELDHQQPEQGLAERKLAEENLIRSCVACHLGTQR